MDDFKKSVGYVNEYYEERGVYVVEIMRVKAMWMF